MMDLAEFTKTLNQYLVKECLLPPMTDEQAKIEYLAYQREEETSTFLNASIAPMRGSVTE